MTPGMTLFTASVVLVVLWLLVAYAIPQYVFADPY